ncbi:MAG: RNA methyltransferase [Lysobacterales bacterium]|jgi:TrmH family RNA methyltransferase|nr:MAG: RNA methyltransferase [Xanthomonadales bacterium]
MSIRIVLAGISHPGNIGSAARAMKTMGLERLHLVAPQRFPATEATVMAAGADDVLERAQVHADVRGAVADCGLVVGTTARSRHLPWRTVEPREAAVEIVAAAAASDVAVVFGAERTGLTNEELERCQLLLTIPTGSSYGSLNVAMAVQIVAYELLLARRDAPGDDGRRGIPLASAREMERFYAHLEEVLEDIEFRDRTGEGHLAARLRRFFNRAVPDQNEINILRGILTSVQGRRRRAGEPPPPKGS